jgi:hypothetical protein
MYGHLINNNDAPIRATQFIALKIENHAEIF